MAINQDIRDSLPEDTLVFDYMSYDNAIIGTTFDGRAIYDYDLMVLELMHDEGWNCDDSIDWIEYNTLRSLPYAGSKAPLIVSLIGGEFNET